MGPIDHLEEVGFEPTFQSTSLIYSLHYQRFAFLFSGTPKLNTLKGKATSTYSTFNQISCTYGICTHVHKVRRVSDQKGYGNH